MEHKSRRTGRSYSDSLSEYLREIGTYALLTADDESALARAAQDGDACALDSLVCANLRFVVAIAKRLRGQQLPLEDLISDGNVGLVRAARRFDPSRGTRFTTYASWWIRQAIAQGVADRAGAVRVPVERVALLHRVGRRARALTQELGREPTHVELAAEMSIPPTEVVRLISVTRGALSLDAAATGIDEASALAPGEHSAHADLSASLMHRELAADLEQALTRLTPREARTLRLAFGLDGDEPMTLLEIGRVLGVTRERARQIKVLALEHLRHNQTGLRLAMHRA